MSILGQLERDLLEAAGRRQAPPVDADLGADAGAERTIRARLSTRVRSRGMRVPLIAFGCLLASATIALAASGVILTGAPVRPEQKLLPNVGEGVPARGASRLLTLRVPDPEGGLPWGMRVVHTTRGETCVQIGRVENGQLGQLGIDGVFHDDGRFHPMPADILPGTIREGVNVSDDDATATVSCSLAGQAVTGYYRGVDRSAGGANGHERTSPTRELRDVYFGMLGAPAVSVSFRAGNTLRTIAVLRPLGAYLIVRRAARTGQVGTGAGQLGTEGDLPAYPPLTAITYRLDGKLCQRGPVVAPGASAHIAEPCPQPHWFSAHNVPPRDSHLPIHVQLQLSHRQISEAQLSFVAPFAVTNAGWDYVIRIPGVSCGRTMNTHHRSEAIATGYDEISVGRNVARGSTVTHGISAPALFAVLCGLPLHPRAVSRRSATVEVLYQRTDGGGSVLLGRTTVRRPPGTSIAPEHSVRSKHR